MSNLNLFEHPEFGSVRTIEKDNGSVVFCASDVAKSLGYENPNEAVVTHCRSGNIEKCYIPHENGIGGVNMNFIPEGDVYRLIARSRLKSAEKFESWVFDEVLPQIRKTGSYSVKPMSTLEMLKAQITLMEEQEKRLNNLDNRLSLIEEEKEKATKDLFAIPVSTESVPEMSLRSKIVMMTRRYANATGISHQDVWNKIYEELYYSYHISIRAYKKIKKNENYLDVAEREGFLDDMFVIVSDLLRKRDVAIN